MALGLTTAASPTDAAIHKEMFGSGSRPSNLAKQTNGTILNEEMNDIVKTVQSHEETRLLMKGASETI